MSRIWLRQNFRSIRYGLKLVGIQPFLALILVVSKFMSTNWFHLFVVVLGFSSSELNFLSTFCSFKVVAQFLPKRMLHRSQFYRELRGSRDFFDGSTWCTPVPVIFWRIYYTQGRRKNCCLKEGIILCYIFNMWNRIQFK